MKQNLIDLLSTLKYPVMLQGSLLPDEPYPTSFFTFWNDYSEDGNHYDNAAAACLWAFDVNFYSSDPALVESVPLEAIALLKSNSWIVSGKGRDLPTDEPTHTGRGFTALYFEYLGG